METTVAQKQFEQMTEIASSLGSLTMAHAADDADQEIQNHLLKALGEVLKARRLFYHDVILKEREELAS